MAPQGPWRWTAERLEELSQELLDWAEDNQNLFLKEFTAARGIPASHVARFSQMSPTWAQALEVVNDLLEVRLLRGGLTGQLEHHVVKLVACSKYGYSEATKSDLAVTAAPGLPSSVEQCNATIKQIEEHKLSLENMLAQARLLPAAIVSE